MALFQRHFKSNYVVDSENTNYDFCVDAPTTLDFGSLSLCEQDIISDFSSLLSSLKQPSYSLCSPLSYAFNISLSTGVSIGQSLQTSKLVKSIK